VIFYGEWSCIGSEPLLEVLISGTWYFRESKTVLDVNLYWKWYSVESETVLEVNPYWKRYFIGSDTWWKVKLYWTWSSIGSATLLEMILYGKWNSIDHFCTNRDNTQQEIQVWTGQHVPKFELVAIDRAGAAVMVQACIQVVSSSKLRQATTYAADFYTAGMLYES
jgi:hypothetical protein